jgi:hypothetical protein
MGAPSDAVAPQDQAAVEQQPCCTASSSESAVPAILREAQGPVATTALVSSTSALPNRHPALRYEFKRPLPDSTGRSRVYSLLCTFRI